MSVTREDLERVATAADFGATLRTVRAHAGFSFRKLEMASNGKLGRTTIGDMEKGRRIVLPIDDGRLEFYLMLCGVPKEDLTAWRETWQRVSGEPINAPRADVAPGHTVRLRTVLLAAVIVAALAVTATLLIQAVQSQDAPAVAGPTNSPDPHAEPADPVAPPLIVADVTRMGRADPNDDFMLPDQLDMDVVALRALNQEIAPDSEKFARWSTEHDVVPLNRGLATLTLRANSKEPLRITRMSVRKECGAPFAGTIFLFPRQGGADPNLKIGVDLDQPDPIVQELYLTGDGLLPKGPDYFQLNTVTLKPGETQTFTIGGFTKRYACAFKLRVFVLTSNQTVFQDIGVGDKPFKVTTWAPSKVEKFPYSGYGAAYLPLSYPSRDWSKVDPQTYATK